MSAEPGGFDHDDVLAQLCSPLSGHEFLRTVFEKEPRLFAQPSAAEAIRGLVSWEDVLAMCAMLSSADGVTRQAARGGAGAAAAPAAPAGAGADAGASLLVFREQCATQTGTPECPSAADAYLDGASIVVNHADACLEKVNGLCRRLATPPDATAAAATAAAPRVPHAFANVYATPACAQAVAAHADDRDVFVLQVAGAKAWRVYGAPPVALPYTDEQVGKTPSLPVPASTLRDANALVDCTLRPGDVLYVPRGFVHEASTGASEASLHVTLAIATHDCTWSLSLIHI